MFANTRKLLLPLVILGLLSACTRPAVAPKPLAFQESADALRDWEGGAKQIALDMAHAGLLPDPGNPAAPVTPAWRTPFYVNVVTRYSQFLREVGQSLEAEILRQGGLSCAHRSARPRSISTSMSRKGARATGSRTEPLSARATGYLMARSPRLGCQAEPRFC